MQRTTGTRCTAGKVKPPSSSSSSSSSPSAFPLTRASPRPCRTVSPQLTSEESSQDFVRRRFSGSEKREERAGTLYLLVLRRGSCRRRRRRREGGLYVPGSSAVEKAGHLSNRALLPSLQSVSVLRSPLRPEAFRGLWRFWRTGIGKCITTGRSGAGLLDLRRISNS